MVGKKSELIIPVLILSLLSMSTLLLAQSKKAIKCFDKGKTALEQHMYVGATVEFTDAIAYEPTYALAYHNRGFAFLAIDQKLTAEKDFRAAIEFDSTMLMSYVYLIPLLRDQENFVDALTFIDAMEKHTEGNVGAAHYQRALCFEKMENLDKAISSYSSAAILFEGEGKDFFQILEECKEKIKNLKKL